MKVQNGQSASALVIGQRPNFTVAYCSASADCEKCSFGHCLVVGLQTACIGNFSAIPCHYVPNFVGSLQNFGKFDNDMI